MKRLIILLGLILTISCTNKTIVSGQELEEEFSKNTLGAWSWENTLNNTIEHNFSWGKGLYKLNESIVFDYLEDGRKTIRIDIPFLGSYKVTNIEKIDDAAYKISILGIFGPLKDESGSLILKRIGIDTILIDDKSFFDIFDFHIGEKRLFRMSKPRE